MGPFLFIMYMHDTLATIFPKFAVDDLVNWSHQWGMVLNTQKTKVMLSSDIGSEVIELKMYDKRIEHVSSMKCMAGSSAQLFVTGGLCGFQS